MVADILGQALLPNRALAEVFGEKEITEAPIGLESAKQLTVAGQMEPSLTRQGTGSQPMQAMEAAAQATQPKTPVRSQNMEIGAAVVEAKPATTTSMAGQADSEVVELDVVEIAPEIQEEVISEEALEESLPGIRMAAAVVAEVLPWAARFSSTMAA